MSGGLILASAGVVGFLLFGTLGMRLCWRASYEILMRRTRRAMEATP